MKHISRDEQLRNMVKQDAWDLVVIGGGATGLGVALDSSSRGLKTLLLERDDFTKGTSSRSTKLVHGGVRYLKQGHIPLVLEALHERGLLRKNAPHLVRPLRFILPANRLWKRWFYGIGLKLYDLLARKLKLGKSRFLKNQMLSELVPSLKVDQLSGGVLYFDGQMDDARLGLALAKTAVEYGATVLNYCEVLGFNFDKEGQIEAVLFKDNTDTDNDDITGKYVVKAKAVVNATGVFVDEIRLLENPQRSPMVKPSQGAHIVLPKKFLPGDTAIIFPETKDGRVLFAIPWYDKVLVGTTDHFLEKIEREPKPFEEELISILEHIEEHLNPKPSKSDVLAVFAGLRPLVVPNAEENNSAAISREHSVFFGAGGLCHVTGGKWTTYRKMAEDVLNQLIKKGLIEALSCQTKSLKLVGWQEQEGPINVQSIYGAESLLVEQIANEQASYQELIHPHLPYRYAEVIYAIRYEWAVTLEDILSRRTRALLLDAQATIDCAPQVATLLAEELGKDEQWCQDQLKSFNHVAQGYLWS